MLHSNTKWVGITFLIRTSTENRNYMGRGTNYIINKCNKINTNCWKEALLDLVSTVKSYSQNDIKLLNEMYGLILTLELITHQ